MRGETERGVLVGTLAPHRASSHRVVFVLGLGEGRFPARATDAGLDASAGTVSSGCVRMLVATQARTTVTLSGRKMGPQS